MHYCFRAGSKHGAFSRLSLLRDPETEFAQENEGAGGFAVRHMMAVISGKEVNSSWSC